MCTKKELVEWLEANVPDDAEILVLDSELSDYVSLDFTCYKLFEYLKISNSILLG